MINEINDYEFIVVIIDLSCIQYLIVDFMKKRRSNYFFENKNSNLPSSSSSQNRQSTNLHSLHKIAQQDSVHHYTEAVGSPKQQQQQQQ